MDNKKRSCIVTDNGQRAKKGTPTKACKLTETSAKKLKIWSLLVKTKFSKLVNSLKENSKNVPISINARFAKSASITAAFCAVIAVASLFITPAHDVYLNSKKMGTVANKAEFETILDGTNKAIADLAGEYNQVFYIPEYIFTLSLKSKLTTSDDLKANIASLSEKVAWGTSLICDGTKLMTFENEESLKRALDSVKALYGGENAEIVNNIEIKREFVLKSDFHADTLVLKNHLKVQTVEHADYNEEIPFETATTKNADMYVDESKTLRAGKKGLKAVLAKIIKINGVETSREILSSKELSAPVSAEVTVGSKERPSGIGTGTLVTPFYGRVTSRFGSRGRGSHKGIDIAGETGSPIKAADEGTVVRAERRSDYGNLIVLDHKNGMQTYYAHLNSIGVSVGEIVEKGQVIGTLGNTGRSTGPHLHFEVRKNDVPCEPTAYLPDI